MKKAPLALVASLATVLSSFFVFDAGASAGPAGKVTVKLVCDRNTTGESVVYFYDANDVYLNSYVAITCTGTGKRSSTITTTVLGAAYGSADTMYTHQGALGDPAPCGGQIVTIPGSARCETLPDVGVTVSLR